LLCFGAGVLGATKIKKDIPRGKFKHPYVNSKCGSFMLAAYFTLQQNDNGFVTNEAKIISATI
jgi:hypothetical protein